MMANVTQTLPQFLLARYDADEAAILNGWDSDGRARVATMWTGGDPGYTTVASDHDDGEWIADGRHVDDASHVQVLFDPARVLADIKAKRRIVELHESWPVLVEQPPTFDPVDTSDPSTFAVRASQQIAWTTQQEYRRIFGGEPPTAPMLRELAAVYADHPDCRREWLP